MAKTSEYPGWKTLAFMPTRPRSMTKYLDEALVTNELAAEFSHRHSSVDRSRLRSSPHNVAEGFETPSVRFGEGLALDGELLRFLPVPFSEEAQPLPKVRHDFGKPVG